MAYPRLFRIFYSTVYTLFNLVLLGLLLITPADAVRQALDNNQVYNVFVIAGCYFLTLVLIILIYASRLYTNRTVLSGIPKTWIPVEKGDVGRRVRKMIVESLSRSAVIAWNARPRLDDDGSTIRRQPETQENVVGVSERKKKAGRYSMLFQKHPTIEKDEKDILIPQHHPVWGDISHEGWSSPTSPDLPNLQYITVILELPHLIEAKAVSLAPPDPSSTVPRVPDLRAVELLQRPAAMGLRDYFTHLTTLGILSPTVSVSNFLSAYEIARFSPEPRTESRFRKLMGLFADILRGMTPLEPTLLATLDTEEGEPESDIDADASSTTTSEGGDMPHNRSAVSLNSNSTRSGSEATIHTVPSRPRATTRNVSSAAIRGIGPGNITRSKTLPILTTPLIKMREPARSHRQGIVIPRTPSHNSFAQTRQPYAASQASASTDSLHSGSSASVIRLNPNANPERGELPYLIRLGRSQSLR